MHIQYTGFSFTLSTSGAFIPLRGLKGDIRTEESSSELPAWIQVSLASGARRLWGKHNLLDRGKGMRVCVCVFDVSVGVNITRTM